MAHRMTRLFSLLLLGGALGVALAPGQTSAQPAGLDGLSPRIDSVRRFFKTGDFGADPYAALARLMDADTRPEGIAMFEQILRVASINPLERFRITAAVVHAGSMLPDSLLSRVRDIWAYAPLTPLDGEHEEVMFHTSLLLAAERFPSDQRWFNGRSSAVNREEAMRILRDWMHITVTEGQEVFDSPTYGPLFIGSMLLLRQFASDAELRVRADLMTTWLLCDYFHAYQGGQFGGAHGRIDMFSALQPLASEMSALAWLYAGDGPQLYAREQLLAALSDYRPPAPVITLAMEKLTPFEAVERKRAARRIRGSGPAEREVLTTTWVHPLYVVGSLRGGLVQPREQHSWDITWTSDRLQTTMFTMHPYSEASMLTEFFPHRADRAYRRVSAIDPYFGTTTKVVGGSPYEDIHQYRNTVIALYDVPAIPRFPVMAGYFPLDVAAFDVDSTASGWITIDAGDVYLAAFPLRPGRLFDQEYGKSFFSSAGRNGMVAHVVGRNEAGSYAQFRKRVRALRVDTTAFGSDGRIRTRTLDGTTLECTYGGSLLVDGAPVQRPADMLFASPWLTSRRGSGTLTLTTPSARLVIDMNAAVMREEAVERK